jgi:hypothetical protein
MAVMELQKLGPEPWGRRMERARHNAHLQFREVEEQLFPHISKSALVRLERLDEVPTQRKDRARAALVLMLYGYDPEDFEIDIGDLPPVIDRKALDKLRRRPRVSTRWEIAENWVEAA